LHVYIFKFTLTSEFH